MTLLNLLPSRQLIAFRYKIICLIFLAFVPASAFADHPKPNSTDASKHTISIENSKVKIGFGSCLHQDAPQAIWQDINKEEPNIWVWLGDNIYGDSSDESVLRSKYEQQNAQLGYQQLKENTFITGVWDDHDYGLNDGGKEFSAKRQSQRAFLDFLNVDKTDVRRFRDGVYGAHNIVSSDGIKIKLILLDTRFFRDALMKDGRKNIENPNGTVLGISQWNWLENELINSNADVHLFASGIQFIPQEHSFEKWANFPKDHKRLLNLIDELKTERPIFLTGDRHLAEISRQIHKQTIIYDVTSSSMNKSYGGFPHEVNRYRIGKNHGEINFGMLTIKRDGDDIIITATLKTTGKTLSETQLRF
jgi:alkaline phosphatase D